MINDFVFNFYINVFILIYIEIIAALYEFCFAEKLEGSWHFGSPSSICGCYAIINVYDRWQGKKPEWGDALKRKEGEEGEEEVAEEEAEEEEEEEEEE